MPADPPPPPVGGIRPADREQYLTALAELEHASAALGAMARRVEDVAVRAQEQMRHGDDVSRVPVEMHLGEVRQELEACFDRFNAARMGTRVWTILLASQEGTSLSELARQFGVSRQYVSKLLKDNGVVHPGDGPARP